MAHLADRILHYGRIYTLNPQQPIVSALALRGERIIAAGDDDDILPLASRETRVEHLNGAAVLPGFIDAHIHWQGTTAALQQVSLLDTTSKMEALERIRAQAMRLPPGEWVLGYGWSHDAWGEASFPTAADIDAVAPQHPVYLKGRSGHAAWVNGEALAKGGVNQNTLDPEGGQIVRDEQGAPTGILFEWPAMDLVASYIPQPTPEVLAQQMRATQDWALSLGMVGFHDFDYPSCLQALQIMREGDFLHQRVLKHVHKDYIEAALRSGLRGGFGDDWLRLGCLKIFADGALGSHTAWMLEPYLGEPDNLGICVTSPDEIYALIREATMAGFAAAVHAIGDRAVREVLNVFERVRAVEAEAGIPRDARRHRIEHVQVISPQDVNRLADLDLIASMQPIHATSDYLVADKSWGAARTPYAYNPRLQLDRGVVVAFGSDSPYDVFGAFKGIHAAVTRQRADGTPGENGWTPAARISLDEAIRGFTVAPAYAASWEDRQGVLKQGYFADLVVLDRDPYQTPATELHAVTARATMVGGEWRYGGI